MPEEINNTMPDETNNIEDLKKAAFFKKMDGFFEEANEQVPEDHEARGCFKVSLAIPKELFKELAYALEETAENDTAAFVKILQTALADPDIDVGNFSSCIVGIPKRA